MAIELDANPYCSAAELLSALRRRHRLTLDELGERAAVAPAQLCRYEQGAVEPTLATLRRILAAFGWSLTFGLEPTMAAVDERLAVDKDPFQLCGVEVIALVEIAACAAADGALLAVGGEIAAVLQGLPVATTDVVLHVHPDHLSVLAAAAAQVHRQLLQGRDGAWELPFLDTCAVVRPAEALPATTVASLAFAPWLKRQEVPVVTLDGLLASGALRPTAAALVARMVERAAAGSIP